MGMKAMEYLNQLTGGTHFSNSLLPVIMSPSSFSLLIILIISPLMNLIPATQFMLPLVLVALKATFTDQLTEATPGLIYTPQPLHRAMPTLPFPPKAPFIIP